MSTVKIYYETQHEILFLYNNIYYQLVGNRFDPRIITNADTLIYIGDIDPYGYDYPLIFINVDSGWILLSYNEGILHEVYSEYNRNDEDQEILSLYVFGLAYINLMAFNNYIPARQLLILSERFRDDLQSLTLTELLSIYPETYEEVFRLNDNMLTLLSYETLLKQLYDLSFIVPEYIIINRLKIYFIPFEQLANIQIIKYEINPLLQPWSSVPYIAENKIITIFTNNETYLIKAQYNVQTNQIYPPI